MRLRTHYSLRLEFSYSPSRAIPFVEKTAKLSNDCDDDKSGYG